MISAHSHSGSIRAGRARGRTSVVTDISHRDAFTGDPPRATGRNDAHARSHRDFVNGKSTLHIR